MRIRVITAWCSLVFVYVFAATDVFAQCGSGSIALAQMLSQDSVAHLFSGTVARIDGGGSAETVVFDVDRVWKGDVGEQAIIYKPIAADRVRSRPPVFARGERYVVIAHRLSVAERTKFGVDGGTFGTDICGDGSRLLSVGAKEIGGIGPGRPPVKRGIGVVIPPRKIKDAPPVYPAAALAAGIRGTVILEINVDKTGKISRARVLRSIPLLDQAAIDCVMQWQYTPTLINGVPQPVDMTTTVTFGPAGDPAKSPGPLK